MAVSRERLDALYNELFGRTGGAEDAGYEYWRDSGLTGEELRDALIAGASADDRAYYDTLQAQYANAGATEDRIRRIYMELFGRGPREEGLQYWLASGLTGEKLRDTIAHAAYMGREGHTGVDFNSYLARQGQLARGDAPAGYRLFDRETGTYIGEGGGTTNTGGGDTPPGYIPPIQVTGAGPGGNPYSVNPSVGGATGGVYSSAGAYDPTYGSVGSYNPYSMPIGQYSPTPEILDAYRFQRFYNTGAVDPLNQGVGSLSYFGIPPELIRASLSGFF